MAKAPAIGYGGGEAGERRMGSGARVLVVGSGGREHALGAALAASPEVGALAYAGGPNAGLEAIAERIPLEAAETAEADLVVIGPEAPLADGLADRLRERGLAVFGPSAAAAELEASKAFTKRIAAEAGIPTAAANVADRLDDALAALAAMAAPPVVKADGLAAGKGVTVAETHAEAEEAIRLIFSGATDGVARVVLEERLTGPEVSLFALSDGETVRALATARDHKRAFDGDRGPNTGGMGAVSPAPGFPAALEEEAMARIVRPAIAALARRGTPYIGVLYAGLMLTAEGPKLIEFNVRFGDPEAQVILPRLAVDPFRLLHATATGRLASTPLALTDDVAVGVVVAAAGYPGEVVRGEPIGGLEAIAAEGVSVYHSGTRLEGGKILSNGGRVLTAVALGPDAGTARGRVYDTLRKLDWPGGRYRRDIAAG
jgi:phosphoribosylamine--glycine ligase